MNTMRIIDTLLAGEVPAGTVRVVITTAGGHKIHALAKVESYPPETPWRDEGFIKVYQVVNRLMVSTFGGRVPCVAIDVEPTTVARDGRTIKCHPMIIRTKASLDAGIVETTFRERDDGGCTVELVAADRTAMAAAKYADCVLNRRRAVKDRIKAIKAIGSTRARRAAAEEVVRRARRAADEAASRVPYEANITKWMYGRAWTASYNEAKTYARITGRAIARLKAMNAAL